MLSQTENKALSKRIIDILPDDPADAVTALALSYACVAVSTGCDDESALEAVRRALRQMREKGKMGTYCHVKGAECDSSECNDYGCGLEPLLRQ